MNLESYKNNCQKTQMQISFKIFKSISLLVALVDSRSKHEDTRRSHDYATYQSFVGFHDL